MRSTRVQAVAAKPRSQSVQGTNGDLGSDRVIVPSLSGPARRFDGPFPTEVGRRLVFSSLLGSLAFGAAWILSGEDSRPVLGVLTLASGVVAIIVFIGARALNEPGQVILLGHAYELGLIALITIGEVWSAPVGGEGYRGVSWVALVLVVFVFLVPAPGRQVVCVAFAGAALGSGLGFAAVAFGRPVSLDEGFVRRFLPTFLAAGLAAAFARLWKTARSTGEAERGVSCYVLGASLGKGGMGEVFSAQHSILGRPAAVKLVDPDRVSARLGEDSRTVFRRFEREARATAKLTSPHVVTLFDFGTTREGTFYYVMERLDGLDLETMVRRHGPLAPERVVHMLLQATDALAEAHALGFIHRDVKPANLFACRVGTRVDFIKVLDFGLVVSAADSETRLTMDGLTSGTPAYMAPEMARSETVDARTDVYGLGCLAYWLLTGRLVFESCSAMEILRQHVEAAPSPPSARAPGVIPSELDEMVLACLEKAPDRRPCSAAELGERLRTVPFARPWDQARARAWWAAPPDPGAGDRHVRGALTGDARAHDLRVSGPG